MCRMYRRGVDGGIRRTDRCPGVRRGRVGGRMQRADRTGVIAVSPTAGPASSAPVVPAAAVLRQDVWRDAHQPSRSRR